MQQKKVKVLVLRTAGTNCDAEMVTAWQMAGAATELRHLNEVSGPQAVTSLDHYAILALPGGFAYGDDLGAGKLLANELIFRFKDSFQRFIDSGRPVLGVCNGFQVLAKTGVLGHLTLQSNRSGHFECRWTTLRNPGSPSLFLKDIDQLYLPVAHGEGRVELGENLSAQKLAGQGQLALCYTDPEGDMSAGYPWNPNGSVGNIAGVTNQAGTVLGLMPHPERFVSAIQHPRWTRQPASQAEGAGLKIFRNAVEYAAG